MSVDDMSLFSFLVKVAKKTRKKKTLSQMRKSSLPLHDSEYEITATCRSLL